jgi:hypothetical protein
MADLDADAVLALARACGQDWIDRETAARIATGAAVAMRAVREAEAALEYEFARAPASGEVACEPAPGHAIRQHDMAVFLAELGRLGTGG